MHTIILESLISDFKRTRSVSENICEPLAIDDYQIQSITETSPPKWHLGHVTWFFEAFLLQDFEQNYQPFHPDFNYLFNSYYQTVGNMQPRPQRGLLSRPTVEEVYAYRAAVDERMLALLDGANEKDLEAILFRTTLGLNHEQQHQELLYMDIKHNLWSNPLRPAYLPGEIAVRSKPTSVLEWEAREGGLVTTGFDGDAFTYDNERPGHKVWLEPHRLATRLITNEEYLLFIEDDGYRRSDLWLSDAWTHIHKHQWDSPLYWEEQDQQWHEFTLHGLKPLNLSAPVAHISYYEADAFARWAGKRLPLEAELENKLMEIPPEGHFNDKGLLHPQAGEGQWFGSLWEWTASPYTAYPRFRPLDGSMGEYNGKFMCNQFVLRGGACVTRVQPVLRAC